MSSLSTHVLDLTNGRPASGVAIRLLCKKDEQWIFCTRAETDGDGRSRLLEDAHFKEGAYRLEFEVGPHFRASGATTAEPGFLETVVIEFNVTEPDRRHHVPLLVSPFGYSTYRGS